MGKHLIEKVLPKYYKEIKMPAVQTAKTPTPDEIWAILEKVAKTQEETALQMKETDRRMKETDQRMKETDQRMKETDQRMKETDQRMKETDQRIDDYNKRFGDFTNRFGEVVEYMVAPNLCDKFEEFNYYFQRAVSNSRYKDHKNNINFQVDVMLENGDLAMLIEVKTKLETADVKDHIERLEKMRKYADLHGDERAFLGAVAGVVIEDTVKEYALRQGLFLIEPSGESFNITAPNNKPKEW
jgi:exonuclease VII large subunit